MPRALVHEDGGNAPKHGNEGNQPPREPDHADIESISVPGSGENRSNGPEGRGDGLSDAVDRAQHGRVRRAVVQEDDGCGQGEGSGRHLEEEHDDDGKPDPYACRLGWRRGRRRSEGEVRRETVRQGEKGEEVLVALRGAETAVDRGIDGELEGHADDSEDGGRETDTLWKHTQSSGEDEGQFLRRGRWVVGVIARRRQEK